MTILVSKELEGTIDFGFEEKIEKKKDDNNFFSIFLSLETINEKVYYGKLKSFDENEKQLSFHVFFRGKDGFDIFDSKEKLRNIKLIFDKKEKQYILNSYKIIKSGLYESHLENMYIFHIVIEGDYL